MSEYTAWASANNADILTVSDDKVALGWEDSEYPTNEAFNYWQNRTDVRLDNIEGPMEEVVSLHSANRATMNANSSFTVPEYVRGSGRLEVYLDGVLCQEGNNGTYKETGTVGGRSTTITWTVAIDNTYDILCRAPKLPQRSAGA